MSSSMVRRVIVAAIGIPSAFGLVYLGGWAVAGVLALLSVVATTEYYDMAVKSGAQPIRWLGYVGAMGIPVFGLGVSPAGWDVEPLLAACLLMLWFLTVLGVGVAARPPNSAPLPSLSVTIFGPLYTAALPTFLILIRHGDPGRTPLAASLLVFYPLVMTWVCDSFAMSGGAAIGGPKLAPVVSPNKTWSGAGSGLAGAVLVALLYGIFVLRPRGISLTIGQMLLLALVVGTLGQLGDLAESLLKRSVGTKDSGTFFPGHGGVLDRLDSLYWVIPLSAFLLYVFGVV
jgi:phosphatidate cytidylyltransferase